MQTIQDTFFMQFINHSHSILRWGVLLTLLISIWNAWRGYSQKSSYNKNDNLWNTLAVACAHSMLVLGLVQYLIGPWGLKNIKNMGMANVMIDKYSRFFAVEHITVMILAIILIQIGRSSSKRANTDFLKHKKILIYFSIALVLILSRIPWPFIQGFESRGWF